MFTSEGSFGKLSVQIGLPTAPVIPPNPSYSNPEHFFVGHKASKGARNINDDTCVLTQVHGGLYGGGEQVSLTPDTNTNQWKLQTESQRTKDRQKISATMHCISNTQFYNSNSASTAFHRASYHVTRSSSGSSDTNMSNGKYASALTGVSGEMGGGGESALIYQAQPGTDSELKINSAVGGIEAWGLSWGLDDGNWHLQVHGVCDKHKGFLGLGKECKSRKPIQASAQCYKYNQTP